METELRHALNLQSTFSNKSNQLNIVVDPINSWLYSTKGFLKVNLRTGFNLLQESMDRLLEQYNGESIRKTMLKQDKIFKEQVKELHRLYRVQKLLVAELRRKELKLSSLPNSRPRAIHNGPDYTDPNTSTRLWSTSACPQASASPFNNTHHTYNFHQRYTLMAEPSSQEPSSSSQDTYRFQRGFDLQQPADADISTCMSAVEDQNPILERCGKDKMISEAPRQDPLYSADGDNDIELTLSIGCGTNKKKPKEMRLINPSTPAISDRGEEGSDPNSASYDRENLGRPHWLFRALSLNRG